MSNSYTHKFTRKYFIAKLYVALSVGAAMRRFDFVLQEGQTYYNKLFLITMPFYQLEELLCNLTGFLV